MRNSKFAMLGMLGGIIYIGLSIYWFYFKYEDIDKLITNIVIGCSFFGIWFNYNRVLLLDQTLDNVEDGIMNHVGDKVLHPNLNTMEV